MHLTQAARPNPPQPPTFCMLLRKHLEGGRILGVQQAGRERIANLLISNRDELGDLQTFTLVAELMGRHSNLILLAPGGRIVDAARRADQDVNPYRTVLPGFPYVPPPAADKLDPAGLTGATLAGRLAEQEGRRPLWQAVLAGIDGIGPLMARELVWRAGPADRPESAGTAGAPDAPAAAPGPEAWVGRLAGAARELAAALADGRWEPRLLCGPGGTPMDVAAFALGHWSGAQQVFPSLSAALDRLYAHREADRASAQLRALLQRALAAHLARTRRKAAAQAEELRAAEAADQLRLRGELLMAHLWQVPKGAASVLLPNLYAPGSPPLEIPLDPALAPPANAQAYFRRYQRAQAGLKTIAAQLEATTAEIDYLEQVETTLTAAESLPDLAEIQRELASGGYLTTGRADSGSRRRRTQAGATPEMAASKPLVLSSSDGLEIWVGRNNRQNDLLTLRLAAPHDLWLHTQRIPGAHVILRLPPGVEPPRRSLEEAAALAAYHSKARQGSNVPVDYTPRKYVRKPGGARPGMVIYERQRTLYVTPDPGQFPLLGEGG